MRYLGIPVGDSLFSTYGRFSISGIDPEQLAQSFVDSGTVNDTKGWISADG